MATIITLPDLDSEQQEALGQLCSEFNLHQQTPLTNDQFISSVVLGIINERKAANINLEADQIREGALALPAEKRRRYAAGAKALLEQIANEP